MPQIVSRFAPRKAPTRDYHQSKERYKNWFSEYIGDIPTLMFYITPIHNKTKPICSSSNGIALGPGGRAWPVYWILEYSRPTDQRKWGGIPCS